MTLLDHILSELKSAGNYNRHDVAKPSVILWTDGESLWKKVAGRVAKSRPAFFQLEPRGIQEYMGPATWIRYRLGKHDGEEIPVVYLPGISRAAFRSPQGFPEEARHLFALQFLGQFWTHPNGKDWTPAAVLSSHEGGMGLDLARDAATMEALSAQLLGVLDTPVESLRGRRLGAPDFNNLAVNDPNGMLLRWIADPKKAEAEWPVERWTAFVAICQQQFGFNPARDGNLHAAEKLAEGEGMWEGVWSRFEEAPSTYRAVRDALARVQPKDLFGATSPRLPQINRAAEDRLRQDLLALAGRPSQEVLGQLVKLANDHRPRASSIWAQLGEAPLAQASTHLGRMAQAIQQGMPGTDWESIAKAYLSSGWQVDAEARKSYAAVRDKADLDAVTAALRTTYLPWLEQQAKRVAAWASDYPNPAKPSARHLPAEPGTVYLFVDGLRTDVALELATLLEGTGLSPASEIAWSPLPSVTATAKPAWNPLAEALAGETLSEKFEPQVAGDGKPLTTEGFRTRITQLGFVWFSGAETGDPSGCGWTEAADFDARGHDEGAKLAWRIQEELQVVRQRISELLQAGWKKVVVTTDHGWLWLPGGLPKTELPAHLTASKWGRCAAPQPGAQHHLPTAPWFWAGQHHVVLAPGATAFRNGVEYAHGGLTIQEALTLMLSVGDSHRAEMANVAVISVRWIGLRVHVEVQGATEAFAIDIRTKAADASTSLLGKNAARQPLRADGKASIVIADDDFAGSAATLVVLHKEDVVAKCPVTIGEN